MTGEVVVVGSQGEIGRATAKALAARGLEIVGVVRPRTGHCPKDYECDLECSSEVDELGHTLHDRHPELAGLVYAAGRQSPRLDETDFGLWQQTMTVNAWSPLRLAWLLRESLQKGGGAAIFVGSVAAFAPGRRAAYAASKAALMAGAKSLAWELGGLGVRVNVVSPGPVETHMIAHWDEATRADRIAQTPLQRFAQPSDVAEAISFLLSASAAHITGASVDVAGGFHMR